MLWFSPPLQTYSVTVIILDFSSRCLVSLQELSKKTSLTERQVTICFCKRLYFTSCFRSFLRRLASRSVRWPSVFVSVCISHLVSLQELSKKTGLTERQVAICFRKRLYFTSCFRSFLRRLASRSVRWPSVFVSVCISHLVSGAF